MNCTEGLAYDLVLTRETVQHPERRLVRGKVVSMQRADMVRSLGLGLLYDQIDLGMVLVIQGRCIWGRCR